MKKYTVTIEVDDSGKILSKFPDAIKRMLTGILCHGNNSWANEYINYLNATVIDVQEEKGAY